MGVLLFGHNPRSPVKAVLAITQGWSYLVRGPLLFCSSLVKSEATWRSPWLRFLPPPKHFCCKNIDRNKQMKSADDNICTYCHIFCGWFPFKSLSNAHYLPCLLPKSGHLVLLYGEYIYFLHAFHITADIVLCAFEFDITADLFCVPYVFDITADLFCVPYAFDIIADLFCVLYAFDITADLFCVLFCWVWSSN